jgi:UDP-2-acetamido-3-amino-2,3-dideoxy-glucuronate N-acetyltransferase
MWGRNLARNFHALGALDAVCDTDAERAAAAAHDYPSVAVERSPAAVMARPGLRGVVIATSAETHFAVAKQAIERGLDAFVEKPLALEARQGQALCDLAAARELILMVGHLLEYHPAITALSELIERGELGRIRYLYSNRLNWGKVRREENALWSFAPHDVAVFLRLLGELPTEVAAHGSGYLTPDIADVTVSHFRFPSGVHAHIHVSWLHPFKEQRLVVIGDRKLATFDDTATSDKLVLHGHSIDWVHRVPVARKADGEIVPLPAGEPLRIECQAFLDAILTRVQPPTDGPSGVRVLEVLERCQRSMERGGAPVSFMESAPAVSNEVFVHETALVDTPADVGAGTKIWHFSHVMKGARIGRSCVLGQNVYVGSTARIGDRVKIQNNVSVYDEVVLEDDVFCGPSMVFTNVRNPRAHVERKDAYEVTRVRKGASLGANCTIRCGVEVGSYAFVGAGAVVTRDVAPHAVVVGNPARQVGWACACGEVLPLLTDATEGTRAACHRCERRFAIDPAGALAEHA